MNLSRSINPLACALLLVGTAPVASASGAVVRRLLGMLFDVPKPTK